VDVDDCGKRVEGGGKGGVWGVALSIGWNPFYGNSVRSVVGFFHLVFFQCWFEVLWICLCVALGRV